MLNLFLNLDQIKRAICEYINNVGLLKEPVKPNTVFFELEVDTHECTYVNGARIEVGKELK